MPEKTNKKVPDDDHDKRAQTDALARKDSPARKRTSKSISRRTKKPVEKASTHKTSKQEKVSKDASPSESPIKKPKAPSATQTSEQKETEPKLKSHPSHEEKAESDKKETEKAQQPVYHSAETESHRVKREVRPRKHPKKRFSRNKKIFAGLVLIVIAGFLIYFYKDALFSTDVLATVNGEPVRYSQINKFLLNMPRENLNETTFKLIISYVVNDTLLKQIAEKEGVTLNESDIEDIYRTRYVALYGSEDRLNEALNEAGLTKEDIYESIRNQLRQAKLMQPFIDSANVSDEELTDFFNQYQQQITLYYSMMLNKTVNSVDDVKDDIKAVLINQKAQEAFADFFNNEYSNATIRFLNKNIDTYYKKTIALIDNLNKTAQRNTDANLSVEENNGSASAVSGKSVEAKATETEEPQQNQDETTSETSTDSDASAEENLPDDMTDTEAGNADSTPTQIDETEAEESTPLTIKAECISSLGLDSKDVVLITSKESSSAAKVEELSAQLSDGYSIKTFDISTESFFDLSQCFDNTITSVPTFICLKNGNYYQGLELSELENAIQGCHI